MSDSSHTEENNDFSNESGYIVHLFAGDQNASELAVLCKICMKFGLTNWDVMTKFLPWRNRAALRTTMCRIIRKQALSEYDGIRADPMKIQQDNDEIIKNIQHHPNYLVKGGVLVNAKWDRSNEEWNQIRKENASKYEIGKEDAEKIEIPSVISIDYMRQQCYKRRQSLLVKRAALRAEKARREKMKREAERKENENENEEEQGSEESTPKENNHSSSPSVDLGVEELQIRSGRQIVIPKYSAKLEQLESSQAKTYFFNP